MWPADKKSETQSRFLDSHERDEHWPKSHGMELQETDLNGFLVQSIIYSPVTYIIQLKCGKVWKRHINQLSERLDSPQEYIEIPVTEIDQDNGAMVSTSETTDSLNVIDL